MPQSIQFHLRIIMRGSEVFLILLGFGLSLAIGISTTNFFFLLFCKKGTPFILYYAPYDFFSEHWPLQNKSISIQYSGCFQNTEVKCVQKKSRLTNCRFTTISSQITVIYMNIFHKTEIQTVILRCWTGLYLNWFYSYGIKSKKFFFLFSPIL